MADQKRYVIGVDGGGSKTHALLVGSDGAVAAESHGGPSNLQREGIHKACITIFELFLDCCRQAQCTCEHVHNIVLGLSGAGRASDRTELIEGLLALGLKRRFPLKRVQVETDVRVALEAAFAGAPGIVLISGTGSIALYRTEDSQFLRAGGWGYILGDEGSGYAIARDGLNAVLRQQDGRSEKTLLTKKALECFGESTVDGLITKIYVDHADIASFAPKVFEATVERDRVATGVLIKNSTELVELVRVLVMQVRPKKKLPVALMGGLLDAENVYSKMVRDKIIHALPHVVVQKPKFAAAFGAAMLGLNAFR